MAVGTGPLATMETDSPLGGILLVSSPVGIMRLAFDDEEPEQVVRALARARGRLPSADPVDRSYDTPVAATTNRCGRPEASSDVPDERHAHLTTAAEQLAEYFDGGRRAFDVPVDLSLTHGFTRATLEFLMTTDFGTTMSYGQVAQAIGSPRAARAVGSACSNNPVPILVPCHRVLTADGRTGGYLGGAARKQFLLDLEGGRHVR